MRRAADSGGLIASMFPGGNRPRSGQRNNAGWWSAFNPFTWALTINSTTVSPTLAYLASGLLSGTGDWPALYGGSTGYLSLQAGSPTYSRNALLGVNGDDLTVQGDGTAYWAAAGNAFADITTEDIVAEMVVRITDTVINPRIFDKRGAGNGYTCYGTNTGPVAFYMDDGTGTVNVVTATLTDGMLAHMVVFIDRSGYGQWYVQGAASGAAVDVSGAALSITKATPFTIAATATGTFPYESDIQLVALWKSAAWLDTHLQAAVAQEMYWRRCGILPQLAPSGDELPTFTRSTTRYFHRTSQTTTPMLHLGGAGLLVVDDDGVLIEGAATNLCLQSQRFHVTWAPVRASVTQDAATAPNDTATADAIHEDATAANTHYIYQNLTFVDGTEYCISVWAKAANRDWLFMYVTRTGVDVYCYFDLSNGTATPAATCNNSGVIDYGNGWYRCWMTFDADTDGAQPLYLFAAESNGDYTFDGLDQDSIYVWGAQQETAAYPTSYIETTISSGTRNADVLDLHADIAAALNTAQQGTVECEIKIPDQDYPASGYVFEVSDGTANNRIVGYVSVTGDEAYTYVIDGGVLQANAGTGGDIVDGSWHKFSMAWQTNRISLKVDDVAGAVDTSCTIPTGLTQMRIGSRIISGGIPLNGWIRNLRIYDRPLY
jgi:hypothetical protein